MPFEDRQIFRRYFNVWLKSMKCAILFSIYEKGVDENANPYINILNWNKMLDRISILDWFINETITVR